MVVNISSIPLERLTGVLMGHDLTEDQVKFYLSRFSGEGGFILLNKEGEVYPAVAVVDTAHDTPEVTIIDSGDGSAGAVLLNDVEMRIRDSGRKRLYINFPARSMTLPVFLQKHGYHSPQRSGTRVRMIKEL